MFRKFTKIIAHFEIAWPGHDPPVTHGHQIAEPLECVTTLEFTVDLPLLPRNTYSAALNFFHFIFHYAPWIEGDKTQQTFSSDITWDLLFLHFSSKILTKIGPEVSRSREEKNRLGTLETFVHSLGKIIDGMGDCLVRSGIRLILCCPLKLNTLQGYTRVSLQ